MDNIKTLVQLKKEFLVKQLKGKMQNSRSLESDINRSLDVLRFCDFELEFSVDFESKIKVYNAFPHLSFRSKICFDDEVRVRCELISVMRIFLYVSK